MGRKLKWILKRVLTRFQIYIQNSIAFAKINFIRHIQYKKAIFIDLLCTCIAILVLYYFWKEIFSYNNFYYTWNEMIGYIVISQILTMQFNKGINEELSEWIYSGKIGNELIRPVQLINELWGMRIGEFIFFILFKASFILVLSRLYLKIGPPKTILYAIFFGVLIILTLKILFYIEYIVGLTAIYTISYHGMKFVKESILLFCSGGIIPLKLLPEQIRVTLEALPFATLLSDPINIYFGKYVYKEIFWCLLKCIIWILILKIIGKRVYEKSILNITIQGG